MNIRPIERQDNTFLAEIVITTMHEYKADPATTVLGDPSLHTMYENYQEPRAVYYIAEVDGKIAGGCGIKQLDGGKEDICELQRMFLKKEARGKGIGKKLLAMCIADARELGYKQVYLESFSKMETALHLYESFGFERISQPL